MTETSKVDGIANAVSILASFGIPPDVQELLVFGDPRRGIRPGALLAVAMPPAQNSALVAEMVAALKGVIRVADRKTDEFDAAKAAIAKAEGRQP